MRNLPVNLLGNASHIGNRHFLEMSSETGAQCATPITRPPPALANTQHGKAGRESSRECPRIKGLFAAC